MAVNKELREFMTSLDIKYMDTGVNWGDLPRNHPDIVKLQQLNPDSSLNSPVKRGAKLKWVWTEEQIEYFKTINDQYKIRELADIMGCKESRISQLRKELGLVTLYKKRN